MIPVVTQAGGLPLPPADYTLRPLAGLLSTRLLSNTLQTPPIKSEMPRIILVTIVSVCIFLVLARLYKIINKVLKPQIQQTQ
jgi:hypothetical protein